MNGKGASPQGRIAIQVQVTSEGKGFATTKAEGAISCDGNGCQGVRNGDGTTDSFKNGTTIGLTTSEGDCAGAERSAKDGRRVGGWAREESAASESDPSCLDCGTTRIGIDSVSIRVPRKENRATYGRCCRSCANGKCAWAGNGTLQFQGAATESALVGADRTD